jgi:hypothetical protein
LLLSSLNPVWVDMSSVGLDQSFGPLSCLGNAHGHVNGWGNDWGPEYLFVRMKTQRKRTELSGATFIFIFLCRCRNEYRNTGNKYENRYFRKQTWNKYDTNMDEKRMIIGTKRPPESCSKTQASHVNRKSCFPNLSR